jgi:5-methylcytosine-specific restriction endonuclease McrA
MDEKEFIEAGREWLKRDKRKTLDRHGQAQVLYKASHLSEYKEASKAHGNKFRASHPDYEKRYVSDHKERINQLSAKWKKTEKGKASEQRYKSKRRTRESEVPNTLTFGEWLDILEKYNYKCAYCGNQLGNGNPPERDHKIPVSRGGNNTKDNIVPSCRNCNSKKGGRLL